MISKARPLAQAIARHRAAQAALEAALPADPSPVRLCAVAFGALDALAEVHCGSDAEFIKKLRYLHACEFRLGGRPSGGLEWGSIAIAVDRHFRLGDAG